MVPQRLVFHLRYFIAQRTRKLNSAQVKDMEVNKGESPKYKSLKYLAQGERESLLLLRRAPLPKCLLALQTSTALTQDSQSPPQATPRDLYAGSRCTEPTETYPGPEGGLRSATPLLHDGQAVGALAGIRGCSRLSLLCSAPTAEKPRPYLPG